MGSIRMLSTNTCLESGLIQVSEGVEAVNVVIEQDKNRLEGQVTEYKHIFEGLGQLPQPIKIYVKGDARPIRQPPRSLPVALETIINRVKEFENLGVIQKVDHPTEWVSDLVAMHRPGRKLRIVLDPHALNKVIQRPR